MALPLKTAGLAELAAFKRRVTRQFGLDRISRASHDAIIEHVEAIEAIVTEMREEGEEDFT